MKALSEGYDLPLWMTEWSQKDPFDWANTMHRLIAEYDVSAVDYMWGFFGQYEAAGRALLLVLEHEEETYTGYALPKHYYVFGQFSRHVRAGARRIYASSSDPEVRVSAFTDGTRAVIVAINNGTDGKVVDVELHGLPTVTSLRPVWTSQTENWASSAPVDIAGGPFAATLPAGSVTSFS
jgi:O-glycosyl hydrolase